MPRPGLGARLASPSLSEVLAVGAVVIGVRIGMTPLADNSLMTHLATGRLILEDGVPGSDPYSFTAAGEPWVVQSWLASLLYALLERAADGYGILLLHGALAGALAGALWVLTRPARTLIPRILVFALTVAVAASTWSERPLMFGLLSLAILLVLAEDRGPPWLALPLLWLWANTHGSFALGLVVLVALLIGRRFDGDDTARVVRVLRWAVAGLLLAVISPLGLDVLVFPVELLGRQEILRHVQEWQAPRFQLWSQRAFLIEIVVFVVALTRRPSYRMALPGVLFIVVALVAARNLSVACIVLTPLLASALGDLGSITGTERRSRNRLALLAVGALGGLVVATSLSRPAFDLDRYPVRLLAEAERTEGRRAAPEIVGNVTEAFLGTDADVFYDDRFDMYPTEVSEDYLVLMRGGRRWKAVLDDHRIDQVIWQEDQPLGTLLVASADWQVAAREEGWLLALRR